jgi:hypothetical protein
VTEPAAPSSGAAGDERLAASGRVADLCFDAAHGDWLLALDAAVTVHAMRRLAPE